MSRWIESHQTLARHPKLRRCARALGVARPTMIGHLHLLWWWAVDYAPDGVITADTADDVADECDWEGDPAEFLAALTAAGFLEATGGGWRIHDWHEHGGKATAQSRADAQEQGRYGAHIRHHVNAGKVDPGCAYCLGGDTAPPPDEPPTTDPTRDPIPPPNGDAIPHPVSTGQDRTLQNRGGSPPSPPDDRTTRPPPPPLTPVAQAMAELGYTGRYDRLGFEAMRQVDRRAGEIRRERDADRPTPVSPLADRVRDVIARGCDADDIEAVAAFAGVPGQVDDVRRVLAGLREAG